MYFQPFVNGRKILVKDLFSTTHGSRRGGRALNRLKFGRNSDLNAEERILGVPPFFSICEFEAYRKVAELRGVVIELPCNNNCQYLK